MNSSISKEERLNNLIWTIRRNYPAYPAYPCTLNNCPNGCEELARGVGLCPKCAEKELGELVKAPDLAERFHNNVKEGCEIIGSMMDAIEYLSLVTIGYNYHKSYKTTKVKGPIKGS